MILMTSEQRPRGHRFGLGRFTSSSPEALRPDRVRMDT